jgi:hypothetical protein
VLYPLSYEGVLSRTLAVAGSASELHPPRLSSAPEPDAWPLLAHRDEIAWPVRTQPDGYVHATCHEIGNPASNPTDQPVDAALSPRARAAMVITRRRSQRRMLRPYCQCWR